jgi:hypothetical protein
MEGVVKDREEARVKERVSESKRKYLSEEVDQRIHLCVLRVLFYHQSSSCVCQPVRT